MNNNNIGTKSNIGKLYRDESEENLLKTSTVLFTVIDGTGIVMNKAVNNPSACYFSGDAIIFTIVIQNLGALAINGLFFKDDIDPSIIPPMGNEFQVTATSGTIVSKTGTVKIEDIAIAALGIVTITIAGKIA